MKFTIEQIEAAIQKVRLDTDIEQDLIAELTKPSWTPAVGEVSAYTNRNDNVEYGIFQPPQPAFKDKIRPLNSSEVPALDCAIEALGTLAGNTVSDVDKTPTHQARIAAQALAKITELTQSNGVE